jgi:hypothetical protein
MIKCANGQNLKHLFLVVSRFPFAFMDATEALELDQTHFKARYRRALAAVKIDRCAKASRDLAVCLRQHPGNTCCLELQAKIADIEKVGIGNTPLYNPVQRTFRTILPFLLISSDIYLMY